MSAWDTGGKRIVPPPIGYRLGGLPGALPARPAQGSVTFWRKLADHAVRWKTRVLAGRALNAVTYGDLDAGRDLTARAVRHGPVGVEQLVTVWTEAILADLPRRVRGRKGTPPVFVSPDLTDIDPRPSSVRWVGRVLAAAANGDDAMRRALVAAVPAERLQEHLTRLLYLASDTVVARDDDFWP